MESRWMTAVILSVLQLKAALYRSMGERGLKFSSVCWNKTSYCAGRKGETGPKDESREFESVIVYLPVKLKELDAQGKRRRRAVVDRLPLRMQALWKALIEAPTLRVVVLIPRSTLLDLEVINFIDERGNRIERKCNDFVFEIVSAANGSKVDVTGGGKKVVGGGTLLHLDSSNFENEVKNLLPEYECIDLDNQPHSVKRLLERLVHLAETPCQRTPELTARLEKLAKVADFRKPVEKGIRGFWAARLGEEGAGVYTVRAPLDQRKILMEVKKPNHEGNLVRKASKTCIWTGVRGDRERYRADWQEGGKQRSKKSFLDRLVCAIYCDKQLMRVKRGQSEKEWKGFLNFRAEGEPLGMPTEEDWRGARERRETGLAAYLHIRLVYMATPGKIEELKGRLRAEGEDVAELLL
jgi:hypothetical protein